MQPNARPAPVAMLVERRSHSRGPKVVFTFTFAGRAVITQTVMPPSVPANGLPGRSERTVKLARQRDLASWIGSLDESARSGEPVARENLAAVMSAQDQISGKCSMAQSVSHLRRPPTRQVRVRSCRNLSTGSMVTSGQPVIRSLAGVPTLAGDLYDRHQSHPAARAGRCRARLAGRQRHRLVGPNCLTDVVARRLAR